MKKHLNINQHESIMEGISASNTLGVKCALKSKENIKKNIDYIIMPTRKLQKKTINYLDELKSKAGPEQVRLMNTAIKMFQENNINTVQSLRKINELLASNKIKDNTKGEKLLHNYKYKQYAKEGTIRKIAAREEAARKIQKTFGRLTVYRVNALEQAFGHKVRSFRVIPRYIGTERKNDVEGLFRETYLKAKMKFLQESTSRTYKFFFQCDFGPETPNITTKMGDKKNEYDVIKDALNRYERLCQSNAKYNLSNARISVNFIETPSGGSLGTESRRREDIYKKQSVVVIKNEGDTCFWHSLAVSSSDNHPRSKHIKEGRRIREDIAMILCKTCGCTWGDKVSIDELPKIEKALECNIYVINIDDLPILGTTCNIWESLLYKSTYKDGLPQYWLLFDNNHFNVITNIKAFMAAKYFCEKCLSCYLHKRQFDEHTCCHTKEKIKISNDKPVLYKDLSKYLSSGVLKGSKEEIKQIFERIGDEEKAMKFIKHIMNPEMMIFDFETDTSTGIHRPNLVCADLLEISDDHDYKKSKIESVQFNNYDDRGVYQNGYNDTYTLCCDKFCNYLFRQREKHSGCLTVIAHNGAGYDNKFILQWALAHNITPNTYIRQGSRITFMTFKKYNIRFVDSLCFFSCRLTELSKAYGIDTLKGHFPHLFNTPANQTYNGNIPSIEEFGYKHMKAGKESKEFLEWHESQKNITWDFQTEFKKYCRADVELLSKAVLKFRALFKQIVDVDPWRYTTLASLCKDIYINKFLPKNTIVSNQGGNKQTSTVSKEWFIHLGNPNIQNEVKINVDINILKSMSWKEANKGKIKIEGVETHRYYRGTRHTFTVDGIDWTTNTIYEYQGCYHHGCCKCFPERVKNYNMTMERSNILRKMGFKVVEIWGCQWCETKKNLKNKLEVEEDARNMNIVMRDALYGGRVEGFKSYVKCKNGQEILSGDIVSLYPTVNALDTYAIGFKQYVRITPEDISSGKFIGWVKLDIIPPTDLYIPVLPDNSNGKLIFHLKPLIGKTYASVEIQLALKMGYKITRIYSALQFEKFDGLMREYVQTFLKLKIETSGKIDQHECDKINEYHSKLGFTFEIKPEDTQDNPGIRSMSKLMLNSLWGKFAQRPNLSDYDFFNDYTKVIKHICDERFTINDVNIINSKCVEIKYTPFEDYNIEPEFISEITAIFTTANARVRLYSFISWLHPSQIIYSDTDSAYFLYDKNNPLHKYPSNDALDLPANVSFGSGLGQWKLDDVNDPIVEMVVGGPKSYSYLNQSGKSVIKQKGITIDVANSQIVHFESVRDMVLNNKQMKCSERFQFKWNETNKDIITKNIARSIQSTLSFKRDIVGYETLPIGYKI